MIQSAFSALGMLGKPSNKFVWYIDSGASNYMTYSSDNLPHVKKYYGVFQIHTTTGENLHTNVIGDIPHPLPINNVFYFLRQVTNFLSIGQLV